MTHEQNDEQDAKVDDSIIAALTELAAEAGEDGFFLAAASRLAAMTDIPLPVVTQVRKSLVEAGLLERCPRRSGYFRLAGAQAPARRHPDDVPGLSGVSAAAFQELMLEMWTAPTPLPRQTGSKRSRPSKTEAKQKGRRQDPGFGLAPSA
jgi:hypothetical protein